MLNPLKRLIRRVLKVPAEPEAPFGAPGTIQTFRAARGYFRYRLLSWVLGHAGTVFGIVFFFLVVRPHFDFKWVEYLTVLEVLGIGTFLLLLPISFLLILLDFEYRWYMVTDRSLRIREGLFKVQERTMTFSNIQNVSIRQGPLQRLFGISDLEVRTAGGGGSQGGSGKNNEFSDNLHLGYFKGVANAPEIRDTILERLRRLRSAGLGDPDDTSMVDTSTVEPPITEPSTTLPPATRGPSDLLAASKHLLAEARNLRQVVSR